MKQNIWQLKFPFELPYFSLLIHNNSISSIKIAPSCAMFHTFSVFCKFPGNFNIFAIICTVAFIIVTIIVLIVLLSMNRHSAKYYTNEDKRNGKCCFRTLILGNALIWFAGNWKKMNNSQTFPYCAHTHTQMDCMKKTSIRFQSPATNSATNFPSMILFIRLTIHHCNRLRRHHWYHLQCEMDKSTIIGCQFHAASSIC